MRMYSDVENYLFCYNAYISFAASLKAIQKLFESSKDVGLICGSFWTNSILTPFPASLHHSLTVLSHAFMSTVTGIRQSIPTINSGGTTLG